MISFVRVRLFVQIMERKKEKKNLNVFTTDLDDMTVLHIN